VQLNYFITGAAGFIGFYVSKRLLEQGDRVIGLDILNNYYDPSLKQARLAILEKYDKFSFIHDDLVNLPVIQDIFRNDKIDKVCHLAAQAGVRYSFENPFTYQKSNLEGFLNLLEVAKQAGVENFVYASSSSVYGANNKIPFDVKDRVDLPISLYAATKRANELMAYTYSYQFDLPTTGLRFFTVYGPWGRPDMAYFKFTEAIFKGREIDVYNFGDMKRDFTYIDDVIDGVISALDKSFNYEIFNLGNSEPVNLGDFIGCIESITGKKAKKRYLPIQPGDVPVTYADIKHSTEKLGYSPKVSISEGLERFVEWFMDYSKRL